jgi:hypothetical protein
VQVLVSRHRLTHEFSITHRNLAIENRPWKAHE